MVSLIFCDLNVQEEIPVFLWLQRRAAVLHLWFVILALFVAQRTRQNHFSLVLYLDRMSHTTLHN
jgi:hypothetical protein